MKLTRKPLLTPAEKKQRFTQVAYTFVMIIAWTVVLAIIIKWKIDEDANFNQNHQKINYNLNK